MAALDSIVQVAPDSTGKKVRNLQVQAVMQNADGTTNVQTVLMQVIGIADASGHLLDLDAVEHLSVMRDELTRIRVVLEEAMSESGTGVGTTDDPTDDEALDLQAEEDT